jgi:Na+-transporting NADH:ubiquinone oxidoreductase subunit NqrC
MIQYKDPKWMLSFESILLFFIVVCFVASILIINYSLDVLKVDKNETYNVDKASSK